MAASAAQIAANRRNALKSTGPKTAEGKTLARANAVKHGLTGAGVALPTEDAALVEQRFLTLQEEMVPSDLASRLLVRQMALSSVRIERAAQQESAALASKVRNAAVEFDLNRLKEIDRLFETIETCPRDHRRRLLAQPEGVDRLTEAFASARDQLRSKAHKRWGLDHHKRIEALLGGTFGDFPMTRTDTLMAVLRGDYSLLNADDAEAYPTAPRKKEFARVEMIRLIELELANLAKVRANLDLDALEQDRAEAADRALFDPDPAAMHARKYEAAATRSFFRALRDFHQYEANGGDPATDSDLGVELGLVATAPEAIIAEVSDEHLADTTDQSSPQSDTADETRSIDDEVPSGATNSARVVERTSRQNEPNLVGEPSHHSPGQSVSIGSSILHHHL